MFLSPLRAEFCNTLVLVHVQSGCRYMAYLGLENVTLLKDLLNNILLLVGTELVVELAVGGAVEDTGGTLPDDTISIGGVWRGSIERRTCG